MTRTLLMLALLAVLFLVPHRAMEDIELSNHRHQQPSGMPSHVALIMSRTNTTILINKGRVDGLRPKDRLIIIRHIDKGWLIVGFTEVQQVVSDQLIAVVLNEQGIENDDEAYIVNRDNSPYSLKAVKDFGKGVEDPAHP
ncbi:MAG TPA: hypothetical protein VKU00_10470 [Chthonomonadaceae bacterium]|nr:hypothetical protein [Chthonomonadaceae bacterium]